MNKKLEWMKILVFLLISFGLTWGIQLAYWMNGHSYSDSGTQFLLAMSMLMPTVANLLTRKIFKEDFKLVGKDSLMLGISFKDKKWIWFLAAFIIPLLYMDLGFLICFIIFPELYNPNGLVEAGLESWMLMLVPLVGVMNGVIASIGGLGEELGWRGYLYPKLEKLVGPVVSVLLGGTIWGVWHYVAIYYGHNFGTDYWGYPYLGCAVFTLSCIANGSLLYLLTKKTGSIWPAAFMHAFNNSGACFLAYFVNDNAIANIDGIFGEMPMMIFIREIPQLVMAVIAVIILCKMSKKDKEK